MSRVVDDRAVWLATKGGKFSIKSFQYGMVQKGFTVFLGSAYLEFLDSKKNEFFHLGSNIERDSNYGQLEEKRLDVDELMFLCKGEEEPCGHILLHCSKAILLWQLVFSMFGSVWVLHSLVKAIYLVGMVISLERREKRHGRLLLFLCSKLFGKKEIEGLLKMLSYLIKSLSSLFCVTF